LIGVLDEQLARYLVRLLDEDPATASAPHARLVEPLRVARANNRSQRSSKGQQRGRLD